MAKIIVVAMEKGGVGKTTVAINLSAALTDRGFRVLLTDLDSQNAATIGLGFDPDDPEQQRIPHTMYEVYIGSVTLEQVIISTAVPKLDLAPANSDLSGLDAEFGNEEGWELILKNALTPLTQNYDFILLDCPPGAIGILTISALVAAHVVLIPFQCEFFPLLALRKLYKTIGLIQQGANPELEIRILRTMYDSRATILREAFEEIKDIAGDQVLDTYIKRAVVHIEASAKGQPVLVYAPHSPAAGAYRQLAQELLYGEKSIT